MFFALLPLPCLRGLKSLMSMTTADLHRLPAMTNLLLIGTWFSDGFFGDLHRRVLHPPPTLTPKNCTCTCAGCTHQQDIKRGPDCYTPGFLPDWLDHHRYPNLAQKGQTSSSAASPPDATLLPDLPS